MNAAIVELAQAILVAERSEIITRKEGDEAKADLEARKAAEYRQALAILRAADGGPIWPAPHTPPKPATPIECLDQLRDSVSVLRDIANLPLGSGLEAQGILRARQAVEKLTGGKIRYSDDGGLQRVQKGE